MGNRFPALVEKVSRSSVRDIVYSENDAMPKDNDKATFSIMASTSLSRVSCLICSKPLNLVTP